MLYFTATDTVNGVELWRTDGTAVGTFMVRDIATGSASSSPTNLLNIGGVLYFTANDGTNGRELWRSDGTVAGTVMVRDIRAGPLVPIQLSWPMLAAGSTSQPTTVRAVSSSGPVMARWLARHSSQI